MSTPGSNILNKAFRLIAKSTVAYYQFSGRVTNDIGIDVSTYAPPFDLQGSLQAIPRTYYVAMGLDFQKTYVNFYCPQGLLDLQRGVSGDLFSYNNRMYQVESLTDWLNIDGWVAALAVLVDAAAPDPSTYVVTPGTVFIVEPQ